MDSYADALGIAPEKSRVAPSLSPAPADSLAGLPSSEPGVSGAFQGRPDDVIEAIRKIKNPQERANALTAFESQMRGTGGKLGAPAADPYASALGIGQAPAAAPESAKSPVAAPGFQSDLSGIADSGKSLRSVAANQLTGIGANIVGGYRGLATLLTGGTMADAAKDVTDYTEKHTYQPTDETARTNVENFGSPANPMNWPMIGLNKLGEGVTDVTGSPAAGAAVNAGGNAALLMLGMRGRAGTAPVEVGPARPGTGVYRDLTAARPAALPAPGEPVTVPQQVPGAAPQGTAQLAPRVNPEAAQPMPQTPEAIAAIAEKAPSKLFPEVPTTAPAGKFSPQDQVQRAKILESVGIDPNKLRRSAVSGDGTGGSTDFQTAKLDSPAGREMKAVIEGEKNALTNHAESLVRETGGSFGVDQSALYARGNAIVAPLDGLKQWFDNKTSALYKAADERAQGVPTNLEGFKGILGDASELTNSDRVHLKGAVEAYAKKLGLIGEDGSFTGSAQQAETMRKYLNEQWSPQNSKWVGKLKDALDEDVTASAGNDIYAEARKLRTMRGQTLDNPNGIAKLMDSSGPEGVNRAVAVEKIADSLTGMPVDQFSHIIKTLKESPPELQPQSQAALAEVKAQFANKVHSIGSAQQGQWNAKGVTKYLQNNAARMAQVFTPEELAKFRNLNDAGHIVAKDQSYPGAAVQGHNLMTQGVMTGLPTAGAGMGGYFAGPAGAAVGAAVGRAAAGAVEGASNMRAVKRRTVKLSDLLTEGK